MRRNIRPLAYHFAPILPILFQFLTFWQVFAVSDRPCGWHGGMMKKKRSILMRRLFLVEFWVLLALTLGGAAYGLWAWFRSIIL
jgi:hypothetical protein